MDRTHLAAIAKSNVAISWNSFFCHRNENHRRCLHTRTPQFSLFVHFVRACHRVICLVTSMLLERLTVGSFVVYSLQLTSKFQPPPLSSSTPSSSPSPSSSSSSSFPLNWRQPDTEHMIPVVGETQRDDSAVRACRKGRSCAMFDRSLWGWSVHSFTFASQFFSAYPDGALSRRIPGGPSSVVSRVPRHGRTKPLFAAWRRRAEVFEDLLGRLLHYVQKQ